MKRINKYSDFVNEKKTEETPPKTDPIWKILDRTAEEICEHGYGKPIDDLIEKVPMFGIEGYGKKLCDPDVLCERWDKLRRKNQVLKKVSFAERMVMLLTHWESLGHGFKHDQNPKNLSFSKWLLEPVTLYRGMPADEISLGVANSETMDHGQFYSWTFRRDMAERFTIPGYASGHFVPKSRANGYIFETEARPIDFHIFMGGYMSDEMEVVLTGPLKVKVAERVNAAKQTA